MIRRLDARTAGVEAVVRALARDPDTVAPEVSRQVEEILAAVQARGDAPLLEYAARFDGHRGDAAGLPPASPARPARPHAFLGDPPPRAPPAPSRARCH